MSTSGSPDPDDLRHTTEQLDRFFDLSPDLVAITDLGGEVLRVNSAAWRRTLGWRPDEVVGRSILDLVHPDDRQATRRTFAAKPAENGTNGRVTARCQTATGSYRWMEWATRALPEWTEVFAVARDVDAAVRHLEIVEMLDRLQRDLAELDEDLGRMMRVVAKTAARLVGDTCVVNLFDTDIEGARPIAFAHRIPARLQPLKEAITQSSAGVPIAQVTLDAIRSQSPALLADPDWSPQDPELHPAFAGYLRDFGVRGVVVAPLVAAGRSFGSVTLSRDADSEAYSEADLDVLVEIANRIAPTIANAQLDETLRSDAQLIASSEDLVARLSLDGIVQTWNRGAERMTGWPTPDIRGRGIAVLTPEGDTDSLTGRVLAAVATGSPQHFNSELATRDGDSFWVSATLAPIRDRADDVVAVAATARDITEQVLAERRLDSLARLDPLTGALNRTAFGNKVSDTVRHDRATRTGAVMLVGIDRFHELNEQHGSAVGDAVLVEVERRLESLMTGLGWVGRIQGDVFAVLLPRHSGRRYWPSAVAARIIAKLSEPVPVPNGDVVEVGATIGTASYPDDAVEPEGLLARAEAAMSFAKQRGGGHAQKYRAGMSSTPDGHQPLEDFRKALRRHQFVLHYQPVVELATRSPVAFEALVRWPKDDGFVMPAHFLPLAEDSGLIIPLGYQLLEKACAQAEAWMRDPQRSTPLAVAINLSRRQFMASDLVDRISNAQKTHGLDPRRVVLEVTETTMFENLAEARDSLRQLHELGFQVALDDFGTGSSSVATIRSLPIDILKIDRAFVSDLGGPDGARALTLVRAMIEMARGLGMRVVAEGVETEVQHELLAALGCDFGQGWLYGKPAPPEEYAGARRS